MAYGVWYASRGEMITVRFADDSVIGFQYEVRLIEFARGSSSTASICCFFVEPVEAPRMTLGMLTDRHSDISVYSIGLGLRTDADRIEVEPSAAAGAAPAVSYAGQAGERLKRDNP